MTHVVLPSESCPRFQIDYEWLVLTVMIPGSQYERDSENRRRMRYAVLSALGQDGYTPVDSSHVGAFRLVGDESSLAHDDDLTTTALFERFKLDGLEKASSDRPKNVLVVWLLQDQFGAHLLHGLHRFLEALNATLAWARSSLGTLP